MRFYYLVASLPALRLDEPPLLALPAFLEEVARLAPALSGELKALLAGRPEDARSGFARGWFSTDTQLRNAVARLRAVRLGVEAGPHLRPHDGFSMALQQAAQEAFAKPDPLARERALDEARWVSAEQLALAAPFGPEAVFAYGVRLQLAEAWAARRAERGAERLQEAVQQVRAAAAA